jgi:ribosome-associated protein
MPPPSLEITYEVPVIIARVRDVAIRGDMIRLGQLLKLSGLAASGAEARSLLDESAVSVNAEPETRRGRQLHLGDVVTIGDESVRVVSL